MVARSGRWLGDPVAVLLAANGSALVRLSSPEYDAEARRLTFEVGRGSVWPAPAAL